MGIVSQLTGFRTLLGQFVSLGVGSGVTKYAAEYSSKGDNQSLERLLQTVVSGFVITGIVFFVTSLALASRLAGWILGDRSLGLLIVLVGIAVPFFSQVEVISRCLQGTLKIREMVILAVIGAVVGLIITIPLIILAGVTGAVLSISLSAMLSFIIGQFYLQRVVLREHHIHLRLFSPDKKMSAKLLRFGGTRGAVGAFEALTLLSIRSMIIGRLGAESNGLYQVAYGLSNQYLSLIFGSIWTYGMPKVATMLDDPAGIARLQNDAVRLLFLILVPLVVFILVFRNIWIPILYSEAFLGAYSLIGWQILGDIFLAISWAASLTIIPKERFGFLMGLNLGRFAIQLGSFWLLLPGVGLQAAPISYALGHGLMMPITLLGIYMYDRFLYSSMNWALIAKSVPALVLTLVLTSGPDNNPMFRYLIPLAVLGIWAITAVNREEVQRAVQMGLSYIARGRR